MEPPSPGTARLFWRGAPMRHSTLALPGLSGRSHPALALPRIAGGKHPYATQPWHCQKKLARITRTPLSSGTARESWLPGARTSSRPPRRILRTATPLAPTATRAPSRCQYSGPIRDTNPTERNIPMFTELCIAFYTVMTLGIASAFLFTHAQQAK